MGWVHNSLCYRLQTLYSLKSLKFDTVVWRHIAQDICAKFVTCMPHSQWWKDALELHHIQIGHPTIWCFKGTVYSHFLSHACFHQKWTKMWFEFWVCVTHCVFKTDYRCLWLQHPHIVPNQTHAAMHKFFQEGTRNRNHRKWSADVAFLGLQFLKPQE